MTTASDLTYAMDRGAIWKSALTLLKESGCEFAPSDITDLAEFLAGDNIPYPISELTRDDSGDDESADSGTESTE